MQYFQVCLLQMLQMGLMMAVGFYVGRSGIMGRAGQRDYSSLLIRVMNPFLIISSVFGKNVSYGTDVILQNLGLGVLFYAATTLLSIPVGRLFSGKGRDKNGLWRMMLIFPNLGFIGIPLVRAVLGSEATLLVSFYIILYNIYFYTFGMRMMGGEISWKKMINTGSVSCVIAVIIFLLKPSMPETLTGFVSTMGDASVPMSMMFVGLSFSRRKIPELFRQGRTLVFCLAKLLALPCLFIPLIRLIPFDATVKAVFFLMLGMPVGSMISILATERGCGEQESADCVVLTSVLSVVTLPVIALMMGAL